MSLKKNLTDVLNRLDYCNSETVGPAWDVLKESIIKEVGELEARVVKLESRKLPPAEKK